MLRPSRLGILACCVIAAGCGAVAAIAAPKIASVTITAPAGLLVGDSATATAVAMGDDGRDHPGRPRHWSSSDPSALSIDANGKMRALIGGRTVTITCEVEGTKGTATVGIASDDSRFGYALADQPTAAGPYAPPAGTSFNSSGGTVELTRSGVGVYSARFAGLGRHPGQRDNVQVSAYNNAPRHCKVDVWNTNGADLIVPVSCFDADGNPADSRYTILAVGAWAFGKSAPLVFAVSVLDTGNFRLDGAATTWNSTGGHVDGVRDSEGHWGTQFVDLASAWQAAAAAIEITAVGTDPRRCRTVGYAKASSSLGILCTGVNGGPRDSKWSLLWMQQGRPSMRFGFAWADNIGATNDYTPFADFRINSSGGSVKSRKTALGQYHMVFAGLARPAGASETVLVQPFLATFDSICDILSWGNTGASDLFVDVDCFDRTGAPTDARFGVMVIQ